MIDARYALWAALAGAFIPVMAVLNGRLGKALGEPTHAVFVLFAVGLLASGLASLVATGRLPSPRSLLLAHPIDFAGGFVVAFYILSITLLVPRLGVGSAILFVMTAQILVSAWIDHSGLLGTTVRPMTALRAGGLLLLIAGLALTQFAAGPEHS